MGFLEGITSAARQPGVGPGTWRPEDLAAKSKNTNTLTGAYGPSEAPSVDVERAAALRAMQQQSGIQDQPVAEQQSVAFASVRESGPGRVVDLLFGGSLARVGSCTATTTLAAFTLHKCPQSLLDSATPTSKRILLLPHLVAMGALPWAVLTEKVTPAQGMGLSGVGAAVGYFLREEGMMQPRATPQRTAAILGVTAAASGVMALYDLMRQNPFVEQGKK